jgi:hypothetical protein
METAWVELADYYELTEDFPMYSAATVLNPSLKWAHMEQTWKEKKEWIQRAKTPGGTAVARDLEVNHIMPCYSI